MHDRTSFYGIDPQESRQRARAMRSGAGDLSSMVAGIGSMLGQVTWAGPGAGRFLDEWDGALRPEIEAATENLHQNAQELDRRADLQDQASR